MLPNYSPSGSTVFSLANPWRWLALGLLSGAPAHAQWATQGTAPPSPLNWVYYDPTLPIEYAGAWGLPNRWPASGAVTIRHEIGLTNLRYYLVEGVADPGSEPFPGGPVIGEGPDTAGFLQLSSLNIEPGGWLQPTVGELAFNGVSQWSGGAIGIGTSHNGRIHNQGQLSVTGPFVLTRNGARGMLNTEHMRIASSFGIQAGGLLTNQSGGLPDVSVAEIVLDGPGTGIVEADGGGGPHPRLVNQGVLRKTGGGSSTITVGIENRADPLRNRAGTIAVGAGTLTLDGDFATHAFHGLKAEIAPGARLVVARPVSMEAGDTTVTGGGVLRLQPTPGNTIGAPPGVTATLTAATGSLESAGGGGVIRNLINKGSLNVTAPSNWWEMTNEGHVRLLADVAPTVFLRNGTPAALGAVLDLEGTHSITGNNATLVQNYALLRKTGPGTAQITLNTNIYGAADPMAGRIEVQQGSLVFPAAVTFVNGGRIRLAHGTTMDLQSSNYLDGGTLTGTGSGKLTLNGGSFLSPLTPENPGSLNFGPGILTLDGGTLYSPVTNHGEIVVASPTNFRRSFIGDNVFTNSGTLRCTPASAGTGRSITLVALVRMVCTPTSVLSLDIGGRPAQTDQWARIGTDGFEQSSIAYGGTLRINFGNFPPVAGDRWKVLDFPADANPGDFAKVEFTNVPAGFVPVSQKLATGYQIGLDAAPAPVTYESWAAAQNFPTPAAGAFDADSDGDGVANGVECALGSNPNAAASIPDMSAVPPDQGGDRFLAARFSRPGGANRATNIQWTGERTASLGGWTDQGVVLEVGPLDAGGRETITARLAEPISENVRAFLRLRVVRTP